MDAKELSRLFRENGVREHCDLCGSDKWTYYDPIRELSVIGLSASEPLQKSVVPCAIPVFMIYCENCGQIKMLAKKVWEAKEVNECQHTETTQRCG